MRTYRTEFPDFEPATMPAVPASWTDTSWRNDACPSFQCGGLLIFVDYAAPQARETHEDMRYTVEANPDAVDGELFHTDDWADVLAFVAAREGAAA